MSKGHWQNLVSLAFAMLFPDALRAFVAYPSERRNISAGQKAMAWALLFPEAASFSSVSLSKARTVLDYSEPLALQVRDGLPLNEAYEKVKEEKQRGQSDDAKRDGLKKPKIGAPSAAPAVSHPLSDVHARAGLSAPPARNPTKMKTVLVAAALVSTLIGMPHAHACIVANAFQSCPDGSFGRSAGGGFASPFPQSAPQNMVGTINGQPFFAHETPNGTFGTMNGQPFFLNRF